MRRSSPSARPGAGPALSPLEPLTGLVQPYREGGLAWVQADLPVDLAGVIPGERVTYREVGRGAHRARGELLEVLQPHPDRITPACPLVTACGSCDRMHLAGPAQLRFKHARVQEALAPFGLEVEPVEPSPRAWGYRRRASFTFFGQAGRLELGAYRAGTHDLLDLEGCPVTDPRLLAARDHIARTLSSLGLEPYREATGEGVLRHLLLQLDPATGATLAVLVVAREAGIDWPAIGRTLLEPTRLETPDGRKPSSLPAAPPLPHALGGISLNLQPARTNALTGRETRHLAGARSLDLRVGEVTLTVPGGVFLQVNLEVAGKLYRTAAEWAGELTGGVLDLYCGVGALGLHLGERAAWGLGIEAHPAAIEAARQSARGNGLACWRFLTGEVDAVLPGLELPGPVALVIVNPPRRGMGAAAVKAVLERRPARLLYVSCNPSSLARDLHGLVAGGYRPTRARPFDMFPQTHHVETLVSLEREGR